MKAPGGGWYCLRALEVANQRFAYVKLRSFVKEVIPSCLQVVTLEAFQCSTPMLTPAF
jgi:hypothetical protein